MSAPAALSAQPAPGGTTQPADPGETPPRAAKHAISPLVLVVLAVVVLVVARRWRRRGRP